MPWSLNKPPKHLKCKSFDRLWHDRTHLFLHKRNTVNWTTCVKKTDPYSGLAASLSEADVSCIIAMAWQDDTPFEAIALQFGLTEPEVIALMRAQLKARSFRVWRMRVRGRAAKHLALQQFRQPRHGSADRTPGSAATHALQAAQTLEDFPLPPSPITRQSLG